MASIFPTLGLGSSNTFQAPWYLLANFVFAHFILVPRSFKQYYGIDHNDSPREDIIKYGAEAVKSGKITQKQLELIKRSSAAHSNRVENYPVFATATVLAVAVGVDNRFINASGLLYTFLHSIKFVEDDDLVRWLLGMREIVLASSNQR